MAEKVAEVDSGMLWITFFRRSAAASKSFSSNIYLSPLYRIFFILFYHSIILCGMQGDSG